VAKQVANIQAHSHAQTQTSQTQRAQRAMMGKTITFADHFTACAILDQAIIIQIINVMTST